MKSKVLATAAAVALAATAAFTACKSSEASCSTAHQCLPDVGYEHLVEKTKVPLADLQGKVVVVNFWATWCAPCKKEIPAFNRVYSAYKEKGVVFLGVLHDNTVDDNGVLNFMSDNEFTYPVVKADGAVLSAYHYPNALPTTFVYDRKGRIVVEHKGPMSEQDLAKHLDRALSNL
jgi:thiol-disulfide isomerase/thioredoxin